MSTSHPGHHGRPWRRLRAQVIAEEPMCTLQLDGCTGVSNTADHIIPLKDGGPPLLRSNLRGACLHCNVVRENQSRKRRNSRRW